MGRHGVVWDLKKYNIIIIIIIIQQMATDSSALKMKDKKMIHFKCVEISLSTKMGIKTQFDFKWASLFPFICLLQLHMVIFVRKQIECTHS